ncbi:MAG: hypothetical protein GEU88_05390 [Solirubrobacterales bacterium]|nr:hypothetical protein [Solirubrobacterales bacterium]
MRGPDPSDPGPDRARLVGARAGRRLPRRLRARVRHDPDRRRHRARQRGDHRPRHPRAPRLARGAGGRARTRADRLAPRPSRRLDRGPDLSPRAPGGGRLTHRSGGDRAGGHHHARPRRDGGGRRRRAQPDRGGAVIDPTTISVVRSGLEQICDEMDLHTIRSAISPIISETNDCAHGIYHPRTGETIAQGHLGLPVFLATMQFTVQAVIERAERQGGFAPGDMWVLNDTYLGGTHLNDVTLLTPVFVDGELFALLANTGHWMDVGGATAGGWNPSAEDIHQEGIVIPPGKLYDRGRLNEELLAMFLANVRLPDDIRGDLGALTSALQKGEQRLGELLARRGVETVRDCLEELIGRSERQMRTYIEEIPDGDYEFADRIDNDGVVDEPIEIRLRIEIRGSEMRIDFAGTSARVRGPINISANTARSACYVALKHVFPDVPVNGGTFRPVTIAIPDGSVIAAEYPSPVSGYLEAVGRILDVVFGALAQAIPERVPAAPFGTTGVVTVGGRHPDTGAYFVGVFPYPGGYGATHQTDGLVHGNTPQSMANFVALEASEHRYPLRFEYFAIREGSGGAGWHRGGDGTTYRVTATGPCTLSVLGDRADSAPFGLHEGGSALPNDVRLITGGTEWRPPMRTKLARQPLAEGDSIEVASPGGGGFGDPLERDLELVERDLNHGYIGPEEAERTYGVRARVESETASRKRWSVERSDRAASAAVPSADVGAQQPRQEAR